MKKILFCAFSLACMAVACNSVEEAAPVQYGEISVALGEPDVEVITRAEDSAADYMVRVFNSNHEMQHEVVYNQFGTCKLPLGIYYVTAENCSEAEAESANEGKGCMRLWGRSTDVVLSVDNLSQTASVNCEVVNARVAVAFDSSVSGRFNDLKVVISGSREVTVNETAADVETETWFYPQTISYKITGKFIQLGKDIEISGTKTLEAKNNIKLLVKLNTSNGQLLPEIVVNTDIDDPTEVPGEFNPYN